ncbi:hypothetical protein B5S32_g4422 [[Candida] boidinii]|uniref:Unnamed protein product n=1 Tax=Candida boidinii TaxID=5477 RepID=A0ACB5TT73_CANBO|nr:hypothetical protein B5S32_g4422 [[Candida] boidinii]GME94107.1 unnamed protein product [[Candida] boidinii]GMF56511.1 unnamed protein product [[Candida] boidinii]
MDIILGIRVKDSVIVATSKAFTRGISILKDTDDKTRNLNDYNIMAFTGESGDTVNFAEYIQANVQLHSMRENFDLSPKAIASFVRNELATSLRSRKPYQVQVLLGGYDNTQNINETEEEKEESKENTDKENERPFLSLIDYLGTRVDLPYCAHGYAAFYTMSLLDHHYKPDMDLEDGLRLLKLCSKELSTRMPMDFKGLNVKVADKNGIRVIDYSD